MAKPLFESRNSRHIYFSNPSNVSAKPALDHASSKGKLDQAVLYISHSQDNTEQVNLWLLCPALTRGGDVKHKWISKYLYQSNAWILNLNNERSVYKSVYIVCGKISDNSCEF